MELSFLLCSPAIVARKVWECLHFSFQVLFSPPGGESSMALGCVEEAVQRGNTSLPTRWGDEGGVEPRRTSAVRGQRIPAFL